MKWSRTWLIALAGVLVGWALAAPAAAAGGAGQGICSHAALAVETQLDLPRGLLAAIAQAESGRWDAKRQASVAWPWTVTAEGAGQFFPNRSAAIAHVRELQRRGVRNIDVGCMQVNLYHHPEAFADLQTAFDPGSNVSYAGRFLRRLEARTSSWGTAIAHYHSATPGRGLPYRAKVERLWRGQRQAAHADAATESRARQQQQAAEYRATIIADYLVRRAARELADPS